MSNIIEKEYEFKNPDFIGTEFETTKFKLKINQDEPDWYEWELHLDANPSILNQIERVEYILHPTYRSRIREVNTPDEGFKLEFAGYDGFKMPVNIYLRERDSNGDNLEINLLFPVETA